MYRPFRRGDRVFFCLNRSIVLAGRESRCLKLGVKFPAGTFSAPLDALDSSSLKFHCKTDGFRIWGILDNLSDFPQTISFRRVVFSVETQESQFWLHDLGWFAIEERSRPLKFKGTHNNLVVDSLHSADDEAATYWAQQYPTLFSDSFLPCQTYIVDKLPLQGTLQLYSHRRTPLTGPSESRLISIELQRLQTEGVIERLSSEPPYCIPLFAVAKPVGIRLVLDFRELNSVCAPLDFVRPNRDHLFASIRQWSVGTSLDLRDAFHQVRVSPKVGRWFCFTHEGQFWRFLRLPMGYRNAPAEFLRALLPTIARARRAISPTSQLVFYMDDIVLLSRDMASHKEDLHKVFSHFQTDSWNMRPHKCLFMRDSFKFVGFSLSGDGWRPLDSQLCALRDIPCPQTQDQWRRVKGWLLQVRRFITQGAHIATLLQSVERLPDRHTWLRFLRTLEQHMLQLCHPTDDTFTVAVDSSQSGWGGILMDSRGIVCCASGVWGSTWGYYLSNDLKAEGALRCLRAFTPRLFGRQVTLFTDNSSLCSFDLRGRHWNTSAFVKRRLAHMLELCPRLRFLPGPSNALPDFLSRQRDLFRVAQGKKETLEEQPALQDTSSQSGAVIPSLVRPIVSSIGLSDREWQDIHRGHVGLDSMLARAREWNLKVDRSWLQKTLNNCMTCRKFANIRFTEQFGNLAPVFEPGERLGCDLIGPIDGQYICTVVDHLTRYMQATILAKATANLVIAALDQWLSLNGEVKSILLDNASYFSGKKMQTWALENNIKLLCIPAYQHRAGCLVERCNRNLLERIKRMLYDNKSFSWQDMVKGAVDACNTMYVRSTQCIPDTLWGRGPEGWRLAAKNVVRAQEVANRARSQGKPLSWQEGDVCL